MTNRKNANRHFDKVMRQANKKQKNMAKKRKSNKNENLQNEADKKKLKHAFLTRRKT